jgi:CMP-N-acetylneuraminic acid synthetase
VGGVSLVGRVGSICNAMDWINNAVISTDSQEIREEASVHGLDGFFLRPDYLATDSATSQDVWRHALEESETHYGQKFSISILLEPTSPLRTTQDIEETVMRVTKDGYDAAVTISPTPSSYTPHKTLEVDSSGLVTFYKQNGKEYLTRQAIPQYFHLNGICYVSRRELVLDRSLTTILEARCASVIIDRPVVNIDEPFDLKLAEWLLQNQ